MLATDDRVRRFLEQLDERPRLDVRRFVADVERLARDIPRVRVSDPNAADERLRLAQQRSRIVHIKMECVRERMFLGGQRERLEDHLYVRYKNFMGKSNERQRRALVNNALEPLVVRMLPLDQCIALAELALGDYESRAFTFRDTVAAMNLRDREA